MGAQRPEDAFSGAGQCTAVRPLSEPITLADNYRSTGSDDHLAVRPLKVDNGLSHSGDPEEEVVVLEETRKEEPGPRVVRAPMVPTQHEIAVHAATHVPNEEWCEFCMAGRARNKLHKRRKQGEGQPREERSEDSEDAGTPSGPASEEALSEDGGASNGPLSEEVTHCGSVPRICMDYFYVFSGEARKCGAKGLTAK